jgi:hypothetical protein
MCGAIFVGLGVKLSFYSFVLLCPTHFNIFPQHSFSCIHYSLFVVPSEMTDRGLTVFPKHTKSFYTLSLEETFFYFFYVPKFLASNTVTDFNINFSNYSHCNTDYNKPINNNHLPNVHTYVCTCTHACV